MKRIVGVGAGLWTLPHALPPGRWVQVWAPTGIVVVELVMADANEAWGTLQVAAGGVSDPFVHPGPDIRIRIQAAGGDVAYVAISE